PATGRCHRSREEICHRIHRAAFSMDVELSQKSRRTQPFAARKLKLVSRRAQRSLPALSTLRGWLRLVFPTLQLHRIERCRGFRLFFASAAALAKENSFPNSLYDKCFFVLWSN